MLRTHNCGQLTAKDLNKETTLSGWVGKVRDHGGVNFVDLRDRWGVTQVVFRPELDKKLHEDAQSLRSEFCIQVTGSVGRRPAGTENAKIPTGEVEVTAKSMKVLSKSAPLPFEIADDDKAGEEVRLAHRFLDLRRPFMQKNLMFRSELIHQVRVFLNGQGFIEFETPILTKSTPEGARDYLVPRVRPLLSGGALFPR